MRKDPFHSSGTLARVGRIEYVNVAPVYYTLERQTTDLPVELICRPPASLNRMMEAGEIDISPVSSAAYARHYREWSLLPNLSISSFGKVMSVILASRCAFKELDQRWVLLSEESASAADMLKLLFAREGLRPCLETGRVSGPDKASADSFDAYLVIGNQALNGAWHQRFPYVYDLGELWTKKTGLPFVFAVWAVRKAFADKHPELVSEIADSFELSKQAGLFHLPEIVSRTSHQLHLFEDCCRRYFSRLRYDLGYFELEGLRAFYKGLHKENIVAEPVRLSFFPASKKVRYYRNQVISPRIGGALPYFSTRKSAWMNLRWPQFAAPLKRVFPQLLYLLRQGRP